MPTPVALSSILMEWRSSLIDSELRGWTTVNNPHCFITMVFTCIAAHWIPVAKLNYHLNNAWIMSAVLLVQWLSLMHFAMMKSSKEPQVSSTLLGQHIIDLKVDSKHCLVLPS
ncbi:hypothetical protein F5887DRAFT_926057 [Amanita rubescens]|nr:hypothetical protein F5887DRAFT_926057 [Amanita rubescens]